MAIKMGLNVLTLFYLQLILAHFLIVCTLHQFFSAATCTSYASHSYTTNNVHHLIQLIYRLCRIYFSLVFFLLLFGQCLNVFHGFMHFTHFQWDQLSRICMSCVFVRKVVYKLLIQHSIVAC